jgi:hypothetical protein
MYVGGASSSSGDVVGGGGGGARSVRTTRFKWDDQEHSLTWAVQGSFKDDAIFVSMFVALFSPGAAAPQRTEVFAIGTSGSRSRASYCVLFLLWGKLLWPANGGHAGG